MIDGRHDRALPIAVPDEIIELSMEENLNCRHQGRAVCPIGAGLACAPADGRSSRPSQAAAIRAKIAVVQSPAGITTAMVAARKRSRKPPRPHGAIPNPIPAEATFMPNEA
jgi:hypothetical protein